MSFRKRAGIPATKLAVLVLRPPQSQQEEPHRLMWESNLGTGRGKSMYVLIDFNSSDADCLRPNQAGGYSMTFVLVNVMMEEVGTPRLVRRQSELSLRCHVQLMAAVTAFLGLQRVGENGALLEDTVLICDEMTNTVRAVERRVPLPSDESNRGSEALHAIVPVHAMEE
jgi:hypothetical protein